MIRPLSVASFALSQRIIQKQPAGTFLPASRMFHVEQSCVNPAEVPLSFIFHDDVPRGTLEPYFKKIVPMCARDAVGLQALTDAVADLLGTAQLDPEAAQLCSARQLAAATRARDALAEAIAARQNGFGLDAAAVCLTDALQALFDLTGENASDATIEEVFETFCVGK